MKERLDILLVSKGYFSSRERAKSEIMAGNVYIGGRLYDKPGTSVDIDSEIELRGDSCPFVGRGGLKLAKALEYFGLNLTDTVGMDVGASTGGFTDCMLQNGAKHVYAVDVGYGQLDWKLRNDVRVTNLEKVNFRYFDKSVLDSPIDFMSIDVSFISLSMMFPVGVKLLSDAGKIVCLIKPQFEAGRSQVGKKGIVKDKSVHRDVIENVASYALTNGLLPTGLTYSPMTGAKGNIEYLMLLEKSGGRKLDIDEFSKALNDTVEEAHSKLMMQD
ncbi:MAG: TlyA family RNA methyltransferase [Anaerovoracaceae bacterium]